MANEHKKAPPVAHRVRSRAHKRNVASDAVQTEWVDHDQIQFNTLQQHQLMVPLALDRSDETIALEELQDLASSYKRWRLTPQSSREIAKSDLLSLALYCDEMVSSRTNSSDELVREVGRLDGLAQTMIWAGLRASDDWPYERCAVHWLGEAPDPTIVAEAARLGAANLKGGDYSDLDLHFAIAELINIFERNTGRLAQAGRRKSTTSICTLAYTFFEIVGPDVSPTSIWNSLDKELRARRKKARSIGEGKS